MPINNNTTRNPLNIRQKIHITINPTTIKIIFRADESILLKDNKMPLIFILLLLGFHFFLQFGKCV
jgi:hypothetical protein